jgi:putative addiction module component (TIGR02574 family)
MSDRANALLSEALQLPEADRARLADGLIESLGPPDELEELTEDEFMAELERRAAEMRDDPSCRIPWEEVQKMR